MAQKRTPSVQHKISLAQLEPEKRDFLVHWSQLYFHIHVLCSWFNTLKAKNQDSELFLLVFKSIVYQE